MIQNNSKNKNLYTLIAEPNYFGHFAMRYPVCKYVPANLEVMNPVCKGRYPCKGVGLYSHGLKSGDIIVGVEANDSFEELRYSPCALNY